MNQTLLITGPPGCGKTTWIQKTLMEHPGPKGYIRLAGPEEDGIEQATDGGIDQAWLCDQVPKLKTFERLEKIDHADADGLLLIEAQQAIPPSKDSLNSIHQSIQYELLTLNINVSRSLHFGRDAELPTQDTLEFIKLESWDYDITGEVWDPNSLSSFWFELVNGAYGDVYRAKALMNLPDGRSFYCNWMVSQQGSQFLPLDTLEAPIGRPKRVSRLVIQGKALDRDGILVTIDDCLLSDDVLEMQQAPLRQQANYSTYLSQ